MRLFDIHLFESAVMGSVSKYLINHCPCPVLVIKLESGEIEARKKMTEAKNATFEQVLGKFVYWRFWCVMYLYVSFL
jgi:hypothetical protein